MRKDDRPGAALLDPHFMAGLGVLLLNDHVLKRACPSLLTGKLSDFAGVFILPLFLHACFELGFAKLRGRPPLPSVANRALSVCAVATVVGFSLPELWLPADRVYRFGLGALQWPFQSMLALLEGRSPGPLLPVSATPDLSDLLATPMVLLSLRIGRRSRDRSPPVAQSFTVAALLFVALIGVPRLAHAEEGERRGVGQSRPGGYTHDGFYLAGEAAAGALFVDSTASISNGFAQAIASTATGEAYGVAGEIGGTLRGTGLVLGARIGHVVSRAPVIETLGERFSLTSMRLVSSQLEMIVEYYPDPSDNLHFGAGFGVLSLEVEGSDGGDSQGPCAALEVGHGFWMGQRWSFSAGARVLAAKLNDDRSRTTFVMPGVFVALLLH